MASPSLVAEVQQLSHRLAAILRTLPRDELRRFQRGQKGAASFLFEIKVLFGLLSALGPEWKVRAKPRNGRMRFVRGPAPKKTGAYFEIERNGTVYHLVHGTQIEDRHGERRAPDMSLQLAAAGDQPTFRAVLGIWDMKLRGKTAASTNKRISDGEYARFAKLRYWLDPPSPGSSYDRLGDLPPAFRVCSIITNGNKVTEPDIVFLEDAVSVVENYHGPSDSCHPSRQDHIGYQTRTGKGP